MKLLPKVLIYAGLIAIALAFTIIAATFYPVIREEAGYLWRNHTPLSSVVKTNEITPIDPLFNIVIPKLGANARIIANVNPYDAKEYQYALARGVAHAKGTSFPGGDGNIFLFSHSSVDFYQATTYNSVFYLISKLEKGDEILLYYHNEKYTYKVTDKKLVDPKDTSYLTQKSTKKMVTLMTCWPPGTSYKRLLVLGEITAQ
jgi:LPXTG-site transpeptidase (sortase) family protein